MEPMEKKFWDFHRSNPSIYDELNALALGMRRTGQKTFGIDGLFAVVRYQRAIKTVDGASDFKLCNNYKPMYARLLMECEPELHGFFRIKACPRSGLASNTYSPDADYGC